MYFNSIDVKSPVEVITGDYKHEWMEAKIIEVIMETKEDEENEVYVETSIVVEFIDGCTQRVTDIYGEGSDHWRYKK